MNRRYFSYGGYVTEYSGCLSLLEGTRLLPFEIAETMPHSRVELRQGTLPSFPDYPVHMPLPDGLLFGNGDRWHRRYCAVYDGEEREYAVLHYSDSSACLTVSPYCRNTAHCVENCTAFEHMALKADALCFHASHIVYGGRSILFTAPCGVGKSTQAALWEKERGAEIVNGDKALILCSGTEVMASGLPYSGSSGICKNIAAPLQAIVVLAQGRENILQPLRGAEAVRHLMSGVICPPWHSEDREKALSLVLDIAKSVPVFHLSCLPHETAVACLEAAL